MYSFARYALDLPVTLTVTAVGLGGYAGAGAYLYRKDELGCNAKTAATVSAAAAVLACGLYAIYRGYRADSAQITYLLSDGTLATRTFRPYSSTFLAEAIDPKATTVLIENFRSCGAEEMHKLASHCKNLRNLALSNCEKMTGSGLEAFENTSLRGLSIAVCPDLTLPGLGSIEKLQGLEELWIESTKPLRDMPITELGLPKNLRFLWLDRFTQVGPDLSFLEGLPLTHLALIRCDVEADSLARLLSLPKLTTFGALECCSKCLSITPEDIQAVAHPELVAFTLDKTLKRFKYLDIDWLSQSGGALASFAKQSEMLSIFRPKLRSGAVAA